MIFYLDFNIESFPTDPRYSSLNWEVGKKIKGGSHERPFTTLLTFTTTN